MVVWFAGGEARARARREAARAEAAERDAERLKAEIAQLQDKARKAEAKVPAVAGPAAAAVPRIL